MIIYEKTWKNKYILYSVIKKRSKYKAIIENIPALHPATDWKINFKNPGWPVGKNPGYLRQPCTWKWEKVRKLSIPVLTKDIPKIAWLGLSATAMMT